MNVNDIQIGNYKVPFDEDGNMLREGGYWPGTNKANYIFEGSLTFEGYGRASSGGTYFRLSNNDNKTMYMFPSDFANAVVRMVKGTVKGTFTFVKKGRKFGVKLVR